MQYMLLIYEDERIYGPDRESPAGASVVRSMSHTAASSVRRASQGRLTE